MKIEKFAIESTNYCNLTCHGCFRNTMQRPQGIITRETFDNALRLGQELKIPTVWLHNWGEPLLHPNIIKLVSLARKNFNVGFTTNGSYLNPYIMDCLAFAGLNYLDISLQNSTPKDLLSHIFNMYDLGLKLGIETWFRSVIFSPAEFYKIHDMVGKDIKVKWQRGMIHDENAYRTTDCPMIDKFFVVYWDGLVVPCCHASDSQLIYTHVSSPYAAEMIDLGRKNIHKLISKGTPLDYCEHCSEVDCDVPVMYRLGGDL